MDWATLQELVHVQSARWREPRSKHSVTMPSTLAALDRDDGRGERSMLLCQRAADAAHQAKMMVCLQYRLLNCLSGVATGAASVLHCHWLRSHGAL